MSSAAQKGTVDVTQLVFDFTEGHRDQKELLGGKGANLAEMTRLGLPVPPGFTITTEACRSYLAAGREPADLRVQVTMALRHLEDNLGRRLGDRHDPLLVSVRSGAMASMPGMMETVLNIGLNDASVKGLAEASGDERFAWDSYRRLLQMFGKTVLGIDGAIFATAMDRVKHAGGHADDVDLDVDDLRALVGQFKAAIVEHSGEEFPQHPREQLDQAIRAVFDSWNTPGPGCTAAGNGSPRTRGRPSTSARWCSATSGTPAAPGWPSPGTPRPAGPARTGTTWCTPRARTSSPASGTLSA